MRLTSRHWNKIYRSHPEDWTRDMLELCTGDELEALCRLLGTPHSGTKAVKTIRLLDMANLRIELATWGESNSDHKKAHEIATGVCARYKRTDLVAMARRAKTFYSPPKRGIVIGLLQWRDQCRRFGQKFNDEIRRAATCNVQYILPGFAV